MSERITLSLSPTGSNPAGSARVTGELLDFHRYQARVLRSEAFACYARGVWRWLTGRQPAARIGGCMDGDFLSPARG